MKRGDYPVHEAKPRKLRSLKKAAANRARQANALVKPSVNLALRLAFGAPDEQSRLWLREDKAKEIVKNASKGYTPTFFNKEGLWRSSRGYFRLFEHKDGNQGLIFGFHHHDLEIEAVANPSFPGGSQNILKNPKDAFLVRLWPVGVTPKLADIDRAIDVYTDSIRKAIADESVLYETDPPKGVFRSGAAAYRLRLFKNLADPSFLKTHVGEVSFYSKILRNGKLVNPFGENLLERILLYFDNGVGIFELRNLQKKDAVKTPGERRRRRRLEHATDGHYPHARLREDAEIIMFRDYHQKSLRYLRNEDMVSPAERKFNRAYYGIKYVAKIGTAFLKQGKYYFRKASLDNAAGWRAFATNVLNAVKGYIIGGVLIVGIGVAMTGLSILGLVRNAVDRDKLIDLSDPLVERFSKPARLIDAFATLERPVRPEAFAEATMLTRPTFDVTPPRGVKEETSFDNWPSDLLEAALQERGRSIIRFYFHKDAEPSARPSKDVRAFKILRTDGLVAVKFIRENIVWGIYNGEPFCPLSPPPPDTLLSKFRPGEVLQIDNAAGAKERETYIPLSEARIFFEKKFGMPLIEKGLPQQKSVLARPKNTSLVRIQDAFRETADEILQARPATFNAEAAQLSSAVAKFVDRVAAEHPEAVDHRTGNFHAFAVNIAATLAYLDERKIPYQFFNVGRGPDRSLQFSCHHASGMALTVMTKTGTDLAILDKGELLKINAPRELLRHVADKLAGTIYKPVTGPRRWLNHRLRTTDFNEIMAATGDVSPRQPNQTVRQRWQPLARLFS